MAGAGAAQARPSLGRRLLRRVPLLGAAIGVGLALWLVARKRAVSDVEDAVDNVGDNDDSSLTGDDPTTEAQVGADKAAGSNDDGAATAPTGEVDPDPPTADK